MNEPMKSGPGIQFFNFHNEQTFHFYTWVTESKLVDIPALVAKAMEQVEGDEWFEMGMDVSSVAQEKLAEILEELLCDQLGVGSLDDFGWVCEADPSLEPLTQPLLSLSLNQICFSVVAEAILRQQGKWAPDKELPEVK